MFSLRGYSIWNFTCVLTKEEMIRPSFSLLTCCSARAQSSRSYHVPSHGSQPPEALHHKFGVSRPGLLKWNWRHGLNRLGGSRCIASEHDHQFDLIVVGGGSGGLACAKEASELGKRVAVLDYVKPTVHGSQWGLGGTCVNVGCIPKKMMHQACLIGHAVKDAKSYGWQVSESDLSHDWMALRNAIQGHIKSLNFGHRVQLKDKNVDYFNALGSFVSDHELCATNKKGKEEVISGANIVIATGLRPKYPNIPGADLGISSDDIFSLKSPPGKTLVVGASYVALECAGFLNGLGYPVTAMVRSIPLRGFDTQAAYLVTDYMKAEGINFLSKTVPKSVAKTSDGRLKVRFLSVETNEENEDVFDTVLWAIGRVPTLDKMGLDKAGVIVDPKTGFVPVDEEERTNVANIFALGDVQHNRPELTPVAIMAGKLLSRRLFAGSKYKMNYGMVPTTVFTPLEYGCVGMSEEEAIATHGANNIDVYHAFYRPLEFELPHRRMEECYIKVIAQLHEPQTIVGMHFLGPNAGEVIQGFAAAMKCSMTLGDLQMTVGIHPTCAEEVVKLRINKRSGKEPTLSGC